VLWCADDGANPEGRAERPAVLGDFPAEVLDPDHAADIVIQRLIDAGFEIVPTTREDRS